MRLQGMFWSLSWGALGAMVLISCTSASGDAGSGAGGDGSVAAGGSDGSVAGDAGETGGANEGVGGDEGGGEAACAVDESYMPAIDPADFVEGVDNPYWPLVPGTTFVFGGAEYVEISVTDMQKEILGIPVVVVRDTVKDAPNGEVVEDTFDWYAQDRDGNVWYMGEDTKEYEGGVVVSTEGSWEAGVDGAQPGIVMHAKPPKAGEPYRQEYLACEAEDYAEIVSSTEMVSVPFGDYDDCIQTREFTPLEPDVNEYKYYCAGVGLVLEVDVASGDRVELESVTEP